ncbi:hypothetical protein [Galactobacter caseinivorans]|uniref:Uncharacterized protein n=1 Tax=Galactobacter caseinivorans TaxID=2676123 RepID=A0A496PMP9_9MICC|nr:hypothetical protein [Galactobacter caseinivorans]RKW71797.1 hypothetical protein DWQ67_02915 [Galactobacter caseinivorans]
MTPDSLPVILTTAGVIAAALLSWMGARFKTKADKDTTSTKTLLDGLLTRLQTVEEKVTSLEAKLKRANTERDEAVRQAREADDTLRDRQELIDDLYQYSAGLIVWGSPTAPAPPPVATWRIRAHAELSDHAATLRLQQDRGTP